MVKYNFPYYYYCQFFSSRSFEGHRWFGGFPILLQLFVFFFKKKSLLNKRKLMPCDQELTTMEGSTNEL